MARHLIVGDGTAVSWADGLVADGAVSIEKMSALGPTELVLGDTFATAPQIRIVGGGTDGRNIVTPWIYGKDVVNWSGSSFVAQVAEVAVSTLSTDATAIGKHRLKVINLTNGASPFEFKNYEIDVDPATNDTPTEQGVLFLAAINADLPHWVKGVTHSSGALSFTGYKKGEAKADGSIQEDLVHMSFAFETEVTATGALNSNGTTDATTYSTTGNRGAGDVYYLKQFENELMGTSHGYYNRLELPNAPTNQVLITNTYDVYSLVATKDGSSSSQIHGVDNLIELNIGLKPGDADSLVVENKLNAYLAGSFPNVIL